MNNSLDLMMLSQKGIFNDLSHFAKNDPHRGIFVLSKILTYLFFEFSNQFVVFFQQFFGHFNLEFLARRIFNFQTVVAGIGHIGELQVIFDFTQFTAGEDTHEDFIIGSQFLDVDFGILGHNGQFFGQWGQGAIVIQQQSYLIGGGNEAILYSKKRTHTHKDKQTQTYIHIY